MFTSYIILDLQRLVCARALSLRTWSSRLHTDLHALCRCHLNLQLHLAWLDSRWGHREDLLQVQGEVLYELFWMSLEKISGKVANFYMVMLSLAEGVVEACPQAVLGLLKSTFLKTNQCSCICKGIFRKIISKDRDISDMWTVLEYVGIALSILSITKRCVTWWMTRGPAQGTSPPSSHSIKAALGFFLPHIAFRTTALAFCWRFLGYNTLWSMAIILLHTIVTFAYLYKNEEIPRSKEGLLFSAVLSLLAPLAFLPDERSHRLLMKRTLVCINIVLLSTLDQISQFWPDIPIFYRSTIWPDFLNQVCINLVLVFTVIYIYVPPLLSSDPAFVPGRSCARKERHLGKKYL